MLHQILARFYDLCAIPHPSGREGAVAKHIVGILTALGLSPEVDGACNIRCTLPGRKNAPGVILQAHTDMVCVSTPGTCYDPERDPISTREVDGWLCSDGRTSLGADNGIGVALMLWLAEHHSRYPHGPITLLFTACEETGLVGAKAMAPQWPEGCRYYINLDAFRGDAVIFASAGGLRQKWSHPLALAQTSKRHAFRLTLSGLTGGHSGFDIHRRRANAVTLLPELLTLTEAEVADFTGGTNFNAIPNQARAVVVTDEPDLLLIRSAQWLESVKKRYGETDPALRLDISPCPVPTRVWQEACLQNTVGFLSALPGGVLAMREDLPDTVADSGNPAVVTVEDGTVTVCHFARCARQATVSALEALTADIAGQYGFARMEVYRYSAWEGRAENTLTALLPELERVALHVGLECSVLLEKAPGMTGIALGFDIEDAHAVTERVRLASIPQTVRRILTLLDALSKEDKE